MIKVLRLWAIIIVVLISVFLRFWQLGDVPPSPDWDEVSLGYNAYSILKTGRDEYGTWFPLVLRSYDDYKPPLYAYLAIPSVALLGLTTFAVRIPSAVMGVLAVIGTFVLVKEFSVLKDPKRENYSESLGILSAFLLAISPWHIQFSRIAFEANIGVTLNIWAVAFFLRGLKSPKWFLAASGVFSLALYAYHSERIFVPLLLIILGLLYWRELKRNLRIVIISCIIGFVLIAPLGVAFLNTNSLMRLRGTSSLADQTGLLARSVKKLEFDQAHGNWWGIVFDNRRLVWAKTLVSGYLSHYSFRWLFLTGDNPRHHAPDMGLLYFWELPFLLWGIYLFTIRKNTVSLLLFSWFLIAPIAASPTTELPHAIRTLVFLPTFQIFTAAGLWQFVVWMRRKKSVFMIILFLIVMTLFAANILYYLHMYFGHMNREFSKYWQYGYKQAVEYTRSFGPKYRKIIISTKIEQPHMFFLFYLRYDPIHYLNQGGTKSGGFAEDRNAFDKYEFRPINWQQEIRDGTILYIGLPSEIPVTPKKSIFYLNGTEAIRIADQ